MRINLQDLSLHQSMEDGEFPKDMKKSSFPNAKWQAQQKMNRHKRKRRDKDE